MPKTTTSNSREYQIPITIGNNPKYTIMKKIDFLIKEINEELIAHYDFINHSTYADVFINDNKRLTIEMSGGKTEYAIYDIEFDRYSENLLDTDIAQKAMCEIYSLPDVAEICDDISDEWNEEMDRMWAESYRW